MRFSLLIGALMLVYLALLFATTARAEWGPYAGQYLRNYDGDTLTAALALYPDPPLTVVQRVRVHGIDTPEINGQCERERRLAREARDYLRDQVLAAGGLVVVVLSGERSFDRLEGKVSIRRDDELASLADIMVAAGHARRSAGPRLSWCGDPT